MPVLPDSEQPAIAIITLLYCEKLAVDAMMDPKTTYVRYKTEGTYATTAHAVVLTYCLGAVAIRKRRSECGTLPACPTLTSHMSITNCPCFYSRNSYDSSMCVRIASSSHLPVHKSSYILAILRHSFGNDTAANQFVVYIPRGRPAANHAVEQIWHLSANFGWAR